MASLTTRATYRPGAGRAAFAVIGACLLAASQLFESALSYLAARDYATARRTGATTFSPDYDVAYRGATVVTAVVALLAYVVTCLWLRRARINAEALAPAHPHERHRGWVWGAWVVPIVFLWFPFQVVRDIATATVEGEHGDRPSPKAIGWWWGAWLTYLAGTQVVARLVPWDGIPTASTARVLVWAELFSAVACVVSLIFWIRITNGVRRSQERAAAGQPRRPQDVSPPPARVGAGAAWALLLIPLLVVATTVPFLVVAAVAGYQAEVENAAGTDRASDSSRSLAEDTGFVRVEALVKGDCIAHPMKESVAPGTVEVVPCRKGHAHEVYAVFDLPAGPFPGDRMSQGAADRRCVREFRSYVGISYDSSDLDLSYLYPDTAELWNEDRSVVCMLDNGFQSRGSEAGSRH